MLKDLLRRTPSNMNMKKGRGEEPDVLKTLWAKCGKCQELIYRDDVKANYYACPKCGAYFRLNAKRRMRMIVDRGSFTPWDEDIQTPDPLQFAGYEEKLEACREKTGLYEGIMTGEASIEGQRIAIGIIDARFLMGSMGYVVGEKITRAVERATEKKLPVILFCCSGGARMQEGMVSLMQMEKTSAALKRHSNAGLLYISVLTDPTTGGVTASFAMLGDIILAEPGALIGFAGPRVIEQTIRQKLPEGFQRSEFLLEHGFIDRIVERSEMRKVLSDLIRMHTCGKPASAPAESELAESHPGKEKKDAWEVVEASRKADRLTALDYIEGIFTDFLELHGDRYFKDDGSIVGGIAMLGDTPVTVIGQQKGKNLKENLVRNFGMPSPDGYRKALRLMKQAEKFHRPVICFVDTPGAYCGMDAEERGQGRAIADNLFEMSDMKTPILSVVIGEGGSGGALAMAVADEVWMMENAIYSILSPEGFASILWKDSKKADEAARVMKITARDLLELGIIEKVIPEDIPASRGNENAICRMLRAQICSFLVQYQQMGAEELANHRYQRFRKM
ncbi:MAG TPA: acetyl-CoA carboxylase, carboxyltransferase subunit beta [Candidatus Ruminococcus avistercoris]|nr:acetyl-CoA carboxylase, carboxyltransferase subunit beta [Candidatus Ruminococcus avistercoris]